MREDRTRVIVLTPNYRIRGDVALAAGARLTDYIVDAAGFFAVTDAEVTDHNGREVLSSGFLNVNRDLVEVIVPVDQVGSMP